MNYERLQMDCDHVIRFISIYQTHRWSFECYPVRIRCCGTLKTHIFLSERMVDGFGEGGSEGGGLERRNERWIELWSELLGTGREKKR